MASPVRYPWGVELLGRQDQVRAVLERFEHAQLVCVFGPAGIGKTALAVAVVAAAGPDRPIQLLEADRLDAGLLDMVPRMVAAGPDARWVVVSRRRLRIPGESVYVLGPLDSEAGVAVLAQALNRAGLRYSPDEVRPLAERLGGHPLALIEAARAIELHGLVGVFARVDTDGVRALPRVVDALQQTWSELGPRARAVFAVARCFARPASAQALLVTTGATDDDLRAVLDRALLVRTPSDPPGFSPAAVWDEVAPLLDGLPDAGDAHARWAIDRGDTRERLAAWDRGEAAAQAVPVLVDVASRALRAGDRAQSERLLAQADAMASAPSERARVLALDALLQRPDDPASAAALYSQAIDLLPPDDRLREVLSGELAAARWEAGQHAEGIVALEAARHAAQLAGDVRAEGVATSNLGVMRHLAGLLPRARELHERALELHGQAEHPRFEAIAHLDLGGLALDEGAAVLAVRHYRAAIDGLADVGDRRLELLARAACRAAQARLGEVDLPSQATELDQLGHPMFAEAARLYERLAQGAAAPLDFDAAPYTARPDEVQLPARLLGQLAAAWSRGRVIVVPDDRSGFRLGPHAVDLTRRVAYRRVFAMFIERRLNGEGPADLDTVIGAGWRGERMAAAAAKNRAHVAMSSLRRLGLADVLETVAQGWQLAPDVVITRSPSR